VTYKGAIKWVSGKYFVLSGMSFMEVDILDPKARKILRELEKLNMISIRKTRGRHSLAVILEQIRSKGDKWPITLGEITKEVEVVRKRGNAKKKKSNN
jgi:hypothetical protein